MGAFTKYIFNVCSAIIPVVSSGGSIINVGLISGGFAVRFMAFCNASKTFGNGLSRSIAVDHGPDLPSNVIAPGWIETGMLEAGLTSPLNQRAYVRRPLTTTRRFVLGTPKILHQTQAGRRLMRPVSSPVKFSQRMAD